MQITLTPEEESILFNLILTNTSYRNEANILSQILWAVDIYNQNYPDAMDSFLRGNLEFIEVTEEEIE